MSDFEKWWDSHDVEKPKLPWAKMIAEAAYLAGQASAEQRVKDLEKLSEAISRDCNNVALERNALQARVSELERENSTLRADYNTMANRAIKAQAGEQKYICDQIPHPETVPCVHCQPMPSTPAAERPELKEKAYNTLMDSLQEKNKRIADHRAALQVAYDFLTGNYKGPHSVMRDVAIVELRNALENTHAR